MDNLLRKKDLVDAIGVAKSTVADWIAEFRVFIPMVKHGAVIYYRPEAIKVLEKIKKLREINHSKVQIMEQLSRDGFPITVEDAAEDVKRVLSGSGPRDTLLTVMQTMGQAIIEIGRQTERQDRIETRIEEYSEQVDGHLAEMLQTIQEMQRQLDDTKAELAATKEQANKSIWKKMFGR